MPATRRRHDRGSPARRAGLRGARAVPVAGDDLLDRPLAGVIGSATADDPRLVVEMWLATRSAEGWHCLMLLRSPDHGSFWQGVSGRAEPGDETLRATARRELLEETGIAAGARILDLGTWTTFQSAFSERWYRKRAIGVVLPAGTGPEGVTLSIEHVEARLVTFEEARALVRWPGNAEALEALERRVRSMS